MSICARSIPCTQPEGEEVGKEIMLAWMNQLWEEGEGEGDGDGEGGSMESRDNQVWVMPNPFNVR